MGRKAIYPHILREPIGFFLVIFFLVIFFLVIFFQITGKMPPGEGSSFVP
jgi:hypothetical protein